MTDPYETLGLTSDVGEAEIRRRYLELVREFPPDREPDRFRAVHEAYEALRDPARRLRVRLFHPETKTDSLEGLAADLRGRLRHVRLPVDTLLALADSP
jgi:curved DNA-binding protein CbpA